MIKLDNHRTDAASLFPAHTTTGVMEVKQAGRWMFLCQVADHLSGGMYAYYNAKTCSSKGSKPKSHATAGGEVRRYFIAAEEVEWKYGPSGLNKYDGGVLNVSGRYVSSFQYHIVIGIKDFCSFKLLYNRG